MVPMLAFGFTGPSRQSGSAEGESGAATKSPSPPPAAGGGETTRPSAIGFEPAAGSARSSPPHPEAKMPAKSAARSASTSERERRRRPTNVDNEATTMTS